ncbi:ferrous iron transport protein B [Pyrolobus fumarii 1A]|uniref:Ferrous iron transport protein B n=1 Tax=Pyrolobus fumarii (strain DSM 11204 / 1A) TaxID=694429 RepID=G0EGF7_PYRF1|nr:ferrous iron transport protein B [Pyrolobus fumarii]AEM39182.1 ferrous iron transport protein B [Pyrolobus fumarii 1A]
MSRECKQAPRDVRAATCKCHLTPSLVVKQECSIVAALAGAPNVGKTSLFNTLTGRAERVANWTGVTVDLKTAVVPYDNQRLCIVDLPGTYGLSGSGPEEQVARDFLIHQKPDVIIALADATNLEKTLYLPLEVAEYSGNTIIALTKIDAAEAKGIKIDVEGLSRDLGIPVVATSSLRGLGLDTLQETIVKVASRPGKPLHIDYGDLEEYIAKLEELLRSECKSTRDGLTRWLAVRLLEGLDWAPRIVEELCGEAAKRVIEEAERLRDEYRRRTGKDPGQHAVAARYRMVEKLVEKHVVKRPARDSSLTKVDVLLLHPIAGPVLSLLLLLGAFLLVFTLNTGFPLNMILDALGFSEAAALLEEYSIAGILGMIFGHIADIIRGSVRPEWLASLLADGIVSGVGLVLSFTPLIAFVYAVFGALEDTGLAPRIAVAFDRFLRKFGVGGKAIFPAIMGLGCNVPAVTAARIIESSRERLVTILAVPLIPCQARLVVILAFTAAFFAEHGPLVTAVVALSMYAVAYAVFLLTTWILSKLLGNEVNEEYFIELPPLQKPSWKVIWWYVRSSVEHFLVRAGTIILVLSIVTWFATSYTPVLAPTDDPGESIAASVGKALAPLIEIVFDVSHDIAWRLGFGFVQGLAAKEVFLEALAMTAPEGIPKTSPEEAISYLNLTPAQAYAVLLAVTLYMPCVATLATIYSEVRNGKLTAAILAYTLSLATLLAFAARVVLQMLLA